MDLIFIPQSGTPFCIEVGYFDSVHEIKEKVEKYQGIPVAKQTFVFSGKVLQDEHNIQYCELFHNSRIHLIVMPDDCLQLQRPGIRLKIRIPVYNTLILLRMNVEDTVARLKEEIQEMENNVLATCMLCHANGVELQDKDKLHDYNLQNNQEIVVSIKPSSIGSSSSAGNPYENLRLMVLLPNSGGIKIPVEVNALENVSELRNKLESLQHQLNFHLPPQGYFFIHKQVFLREDCSFFWNRVNQGDTIEIL